MRTQSNSHRDLTLDIAPIVNRCATCNVAETILGNRSTPSFHLTALMMYPWRGCTYIYTHTQTRYTYACRNDMYLAKCRRFWKAFRKIRSRGVRQDKHCAGLQWIRSLFYMYIDSIWLGDFKVSLRK